MKTTLLAYAKINLGLNIYQLKPWQKKHKLKSIFVSIDNFVDSIEIAHHSHLVIEHYCDTQLVIFKDDHLMRAIKFLQTKYQQHFNYKIVIHHQIPSGAGLGGSSAAVGKVLKHLCVENGLKLSRHLLKQIALKVGSDVPYFMSDEPCCLVSGYGHIIKPLKLELPCFELIPTKIECQSKIVFETFDQLSQSQPKNNFLQITNALPDFKKCIIINNLEPAVFSLYPELSALKTPFTCLTGSGSYFIRFKE